MARFLSLDPLAAKYPSLSDYCYVGGNPIAFIDIDGREIIPGKNWKGSDYERVFNNLYENNEVFKEITKDYEGDKVDYTLNNVGVRGRPDALGTTEVDWAQVDANNPGKMVVKNGKDPNYLDMKTSFNPGREMFTNEEGKTMVMTDIGRAVTVIHEAVHAKIMYGAAGNVIDDAAGQHSTMGNEYFEMMRNALALYDPSLNSQQLDLLTITGNLTNERIIAYAKEYWKQEISPNATEENGAIEQAANKIKDEFKKLIYEEQ